MIYLFTGNNRYLVHKEAQKWKSAFKDKFGEENVTHITSLENTSIDFVLEALLSRSLFSEKRLVIIDGFPYNWDKAFSGATDMEKSILESLPGIPEETLVAFLSVSPDKRKAWYKQLSKQAEVKEFSITWEDQVFWILSQQYSQKIDSNALQRLIFLKWWDLQKSISEIEKLLISYEKISLEQVNSILIPEFEESIFVFIDTLLTKNKKKIFSEFQNLLDFSNLYALYQSILANLRVFLYIELLKSQKKSSSQIGDILKLWNRQFLINKRHASSYKDVSNLYIELLNFDKNMKFWKFVSSDEEDMKKELENIFLKFVA